MITVKVACFYGGSAYKPRLVPVECEDDCWPAIAHIPASQRGATEYYRLAGMTDPLRLPDGTSESLPRYQFAYRTRVKLRTSSNRSASRRLQDDAHA